FAQALFSAALQFFAEAVYFSPFSAVEIPLELFDPADLMHLRNRLQLDLHVPQRPHAIKDFLEAPLQVRNLGMFALGPREFKRRNQPSRADPEVMDRFPRSSGAGFLPSLRKIPPGLIK